MHPSAAAYRKIAEDISEDLSNAEARYTNLAKATIKPDPKQPRVDYSLQRDDWVAGCPAALPLGEEHPLGATNYQEWEASSTAEAGLSVASAGCGAGEANGKLSRIK